MRRKSVFAALFVVVCAGFVWPTVGSADVLDEYEQSLKLSVTPFQVYVELRLTPGVEIADRVFALIDVDRDGDMSFEEVQAYGRRVSEDLTLEVDGRRVSLEAAGYRLLGRDEVKNRQRPIVFPFVALVRSFEPGVEQLTVGQHQITLRNDHLPELSPYQANVLAPRFETIRITGQQRDALQRELRLRFQVDSTIPLTAGTATAQVGWLDWIGVFLTGLFVMLLLGRRIVRRVITSYHTA